MYRAAEQRHERGTEGDEVIIPTIMILDRDPDSQDEVLNIQFDEDTLIIHALMDVTISLLGPGYPTGTLRFKEGQVLMMPFMGE